MLTSVYVGKGGHMHDKSLVVAYDLSSFIHFVHIVYLNLLVLVQQDR